MTRTATAERATAETTIRVRVDLDGTGRASVETPIGFLDHLLTLFARHALVDL
jgi:imidazoleglycerol-phosphate dehydratase